MDVADLEVRIKSGKAVTDVNKIDKKLKGLGETSEKTKKSISGLGGAIVAIAGGAVVRQFIQTAGAFQSMSASLEVVTGSAEKANMAMDGIREFAKNTPFQVSEITSGFIKLKALGIAPTEKSMTSFGNTASAMGKSLDQMIEAVADAATGEFERLKEFGIKSKSQGDQVTFTFQGISTTVKKTSEEITGYLESIGTNNFGGAMAKQMDTINGKISNLGDAVDDFFVKFSEAGGGNIVVGALELMISTVQNLSDAFKWAETAGKRLALVMGDSPRLVADVDSEIASLTSRISDMQSVADRAGEKGTGFFSKLWFGDKATYDANVKDMNKQLVILAQERAKSEAFHGRQPEARKGGGITEAGATTVDPAVAREAALDREFEAASEHTDRMLRLIEMEEDAKASSLKAEKQMAADKLNIAKSLFGNMSTLMASSSKSEFEIGKKFAIGNALIKGYEAVTSSYAAGAKIGGPWLGAAYAATAGYATKIQIDNIKKQQFGGGGSLSVSSGAGGGVSTGATFNGGAPTVPITQDSQQSGGTTTINLIGQDKTFTGGQINEVFDQISDALERGDRVLFSSESRQALELNT